MKQLSILKWNKRKQKNEGDAWCITFVFYKAQQNKFAKNKTASKSILRSPTLLLTQHLFRLELRVRQPEY